MGYLPYKTNKSKMGCGNREERERERKREREGGGKENLRFFFYGDFRKQMAKQESDETSSSWKCC